MKYVLIGLLKVYRLVISPLYGNVCRYYPSCSAYALRAVEVHGAVRGSWYAGRRLLRCHPWAPGGYDPVPGTPEFTLEMQEQAEASVTMESRSGTRSPVPAGVGAQVGVGSPGPAGARSINIRAVDHRNGDRDRAEQAAPRGRRGVNAWKP